MTLPLHTQAMDDAHKFVVNLIQLLRLDERKLLIQEDVAFLNHLIASVDHHDAPSNLLSPANYIAM